MKLRNKKTGEIVDFQGITMFKHPTGSWAGSYKKLSELNERWEDYEEDKYYYAITSIKADAGITKMKNIHNDMTAFDKSIGNYFENREEAEKAVEKLKAFKRLKDKGFRFDGKTLDTSKGFGSIFYWLDENAYSEDYIDDLDLLFGGEK